jgi:hypothetical protein
MAFFTLLEQVLTGGRLHPEHLLANAVNFLILQIAEERVLLEIPHAEEHLVLREGLRDDGDIFDDDVYHLGGSLATVDSGESVPPALVYLGVVLEFLAKRAAHAY